MINAASQSSIALDRIAVTTTNPRRVVRDTHFSDLVASIRTHGILQPILVRPREYAADCATSGTFDAYELVAGHRRFAAAMEAELLEVPAFIRELSDQEVLEIQVIENLQRSDLHALEEAQGYQQLQHHGYDVARIAERIGRSAKYVYDRLKLLSLTKAAQQLFLDDRFTAGHAVILARLKPADQVRALYVGPVAEYGGVGGPLFVEEGSLFTEAEQEDHEADRAADPYHGMKCRSVRELQAWVDQHVRFDPSAGDLPDLFPEAHVELTRAAEEAEKVVLITHDYVIPADARDGGKVLTERSWRRADGLWGSKPCEHAVTGVIAIGAGRGQAFRVCTAKEKCKTHWADWQKERALREKHVAKSGGNGEAREAAERQRREEEVARTAAERKRRVAAMPKVLKAIAAATAKAPAGATSPLADLILARLKQYGEALSTTLPRGKSAEDLVRYIAFTVITADARSAWGWDDTAKRAKVVGVDVRKILDEVSPVQTSAKPMAPAKKKAAKAKKPAKRKAVKR